MKNTGRVFGILALILASVLSGSRAHGDDAKRGANARFVFGVTGGVGIPTDQPPIWVGGAPNPVPAEIEYYSGFCGGAFADFWASPAIAVGLDVARTRFRASDYLPPPFLTDYTELDEVSASFLQYGIHVKWSPMRSAPVSPWLQAGLGGWRAQQDVTTRIYSGGVSTNRQTTRSEGTAEFSLGAGARFWDNGAGTSLGLAAAHHWALQDTEAPGSFATVALTLMFSTAD